ncbi:MAG: helix-turn-helix transcriptional regulator [Clostridia bacterium]|nr:helix-turn-helix transcriptional regulator [Clostridia bacterium]
MAFSDILRHLRRKNDMTQEELAEALDMSPQAVSRWETGTAFPDSTVIRRLAYLFDVTTDYLLEVDPDGVEREVSRRILQSFDGMVPQDGAALLRNALKDYPRNESLTFALASLLYHKIYLPLPDSTEGQEALHESCKLWEQLYARTGEREHLEHLLHVLRDMGRPERGKELLRTLEYNVRAEMEIELASGEERLRLIKEHAYYLLTKLNLYVHRIGTDELLPPEERITILKQMYEADRTLVPDDRECFSDWNASAIPYELAKLYAGTGNTDEAMHWLEITRKASFRDYTPPYPLNSPVFRGMGAKRNGRYGEDWLLKQLTEDPAFADLRNDPRFEAMRQELIVWLEPEWAAITLGESAQT